MLSTNIYFCKAFSLDVYNFWFTAQKMKFSIKDFFSNRQGRMPQQKRFTVGQKGIYRGALAKKYLKKVI